MSSELVNKVSDDIRSGVSIAVSKVTHGVTDAVSLVSSSVGDAVHSVSSGVMRLMTTPPCEGNEGKDVSLDENEYCSYPYAFATLDDADYLPSLPLDTESMKEAASVVDDELGISEDYFTEPENFEVSSCAGVEELENAIEKCKEFILSCEGASERRRILVHRLIQLRICLERTKDEVEISSLGILIIKGHHLVSASSPIKHSAKQYCDKCSQVVWAVVHTLYVCSICGYQCHAKCVKKIGRRCASLRFSEHPNYVFKICPEVGLSAQDYRCAECHNLITNTRRKSIRCFRATFDKESAWSEPRLCDYSGRYYCPACHWHVPEISPARVVHNWDFDERPVSQTSKQLLTYMQKKPLLNLEDLNPHLFLFVEELSTIKKLREDLILMKSYLTTCRTAQESRLLRMLQDRQHFVDDAQMYSMGDLIDLNKGTLVPYLTKIHNSFSDHIKTTCLTCKGKGIICLLCGTGDPIFPFDEGVLVCDSCQATLHQKCLLLSADGSFVCRSCSHLQIGKHLDFSLQ